MSALMYAADNGDIRLVKYLVTAGADIAKTNHNKTAKDFAEQALTKLEDVYKKLQTNKRFKETDGKLTHEFERCNPELEKCKTYNTDSKH